MENTIVDEKSYECKMQKIREIFSTLNKIQQQQLLMELVPYYMMNMDHSNYSRSGDQAVGLNIAQKKITLPNFN